MLLLINLITQMLLEPGTEDGGGGIDFLTLCGSSRAVHEEEEGGGDGGDSSSSLASDCLSLTKSSISSGESSAANADADADAGRTPLHTAVESAAPYEVIKSLLSKDPAAAGVQDLHGVTPLMLAAAQGKSCSKKTIKALLRASPRTVNVEDEEGLSAVEHALLSEVPHDILHIIQKSCAVQQMMQDACERERKSKVETFMAQRLSTEKLAGSSISYGQDIHNATRASMARTSLVLEAVLRKS
eukprot:CAMPEP_0178664470 /NCGR_PEP_ID=MMETSP0698-20121128/29411_1 /TAXON_ID=265572 /ORGANISM="Extubocellulus spinifer, Strain CCMP396" /LENGTH=242 /DNA_ID=CAMNT_0020307667 /DNA_START=166 /DNA_END=892 /DNA_ORIENTATION=-